jgi:hypothetical protein
VWSAQRRARSGENSLLRTRCERGTRPSAQRAEADDTEDALEPTRGAGVGPDADVDECAGRGGGSLFEPVFASLTDGETAAEAGRSGMDAAGGSVRAWGGAAVACSDATGDGLVDAGRRSASAITPTASAATDAATSGSESFDRVGPDTDGTSSAPPESEALGAARGGGAMSTGTGNAGSGARPPKAATLASRNASRIASALGHLPALSNASARSTA